MALRTRLTRKLGIQHPIVLAPMRGMAGGALARAVSRAGAFGMVGVGGWHHSDSDIMDRELPLVHGEKFGIGLITWALANRPHLLAEAIERSPTAIMFSFGSPAPYLSKVRDAGILSICQVQTVRMAREALDQGADIIVAQGAEAGGHGGSRSTFPLVPAIADAVARENSDSIVVAAGGIADGRGLAAALMLGAEGVLMGTRFAAALECRIDAFTQSIMVSADGDETLRSNVFDVIREANWPKEFTGRAVANGMSHQWERCQEKLERDEAAKERFRQAFEKRDREYWTVWAGEALDLIHSIPSAASIVENTIREAEATIAERCRAIERL